MTSDEGTTRRAFMDQVRKNLSRHCVSLELVRSDLPSPETWGYATGILFDMEGRKLVLTAGHWVDRVTEARNEAALEEIHIRYSHISDQLDARTLTDDDGLAEILHRAKEFDGAFLAVPSEMSDEIERQDNQFFTKDDCIRGTLSEMHLAMVSGYPFQAKITTRHTAFYSQQGGKLFQHDQVSLGSLAFQSTLLRPIESELGRLDPGFNCDSDEFLFLPFLGKINAREESEVTSAEGMSGGPVVAFPVSEKNLMQPRLLGMQVSQKSIDKSSGKEITELKSVSIRRLLDWIGTAGD